MRVSRAENNWIVRVLKAGDEYLNVTMLDGARFNVATETSGLTEAKSDIAVISAVNDLYLPEQASVHAENLTAEYCEDAVA